MDLWQYSYIDNDGNTDLAFIQDRKYFKPLYRLLALEEELCSTQQLLTLFDQ
jgi:hypothetical protein